MSWIGGLEVSDESHRCSLQSTSIERQLQVHLTAVAVKRTRDPNWRGEEGGVVYLGEINELSPQVSRDDVQIPASWWRVRRSTALK